MPDRRKPCRSGFLQQSTNYSPYAIKLLSISCRARRVGPSVNLWLAGHAMGVLKGIIIAVALIAVGKVSDL